MLAARVIPVLLHNGRDLVKGERFDSWRVVGNPLQAMNVHNRRGVDELILLDVTATRAGRGPAFAFVARMAEAFDCPLTVGGGIRSVEDVRTLLRSGADKVAIGTRYDVIADVVEEFGSQSVVASVDYAKGQAYHTAGQEFWGCHPIDLALRAEAMGAGEILLQSILGDGTMCGYDLKTLRDVCHVVQRPVIACGGCSGYEDMGKALNAGAAAVAAGALFQFTEHTPKGAVKHLANEGHVVRV